MQNYVQDVICTYVKRTPLTDQSLIKCYIMPLNASVSVINVPMFVPMPKVAPCSKADSAFDKIICGFSGLKSYS